MKFSSILDKYIQFFSHRQEICSIVLVGSAITSDYPTDIDVLLINNDQKKAVESIKTFSKSTNIPIVISDDAFRLQDDNIEVSLVPKKINQIKTELKKIILGKNLGRNYCPWAVGGYFPEVFITDLLIAQALWENHDVHINNLQKYINSNLSSFFIKFQKYLREEIDIKSNYLNSTVSRNSLFHTSLQNDLDIANVRLAFAMDNKIFPGIKKFDKYLDGISKKSLNIIKKIVN